MTMTVNFATKHNEEDERAPSSVEAKEASLRAFLESKPRNGKFTAELAIVLTEKAKTTTNPKIQAEAVQLAKRAIEVAPQRPFGYAALSVASTSHMERMQALKQAIELSDNHIMARAAFWVRLLVEPREDQALAVKGKIAKASSTHPMRVQLATSEVKTYQRVEQELHAIFSTKEALSQQQREFIGKYEYRLGIFFRKLDPPSLNRPRARKHFHNCIAYGCEKSEIAHFWMGTLPEGQSTNSSGDGTTSAALQKCPAAYIVSLYSTFAHNFDELLVEKLNYQTPTKLRQLLDRTVPSKLAFQRALDLGCGTGLSGIAFEDIIDYMVGIDLSPEMVNKAKSRGCYDELRVGDVTDALKEVDAYDLIFACDVFVYIGNLQDVFQGAAKTLNSNGLFCFSTEYMLSSSAGTRPYMLHENARFAHKQSYLEQLAEESRFTILKIEKCPIRKNGGKPVEGLLVVLSSQ